MSERSKTIYTALSTNSKASIDMEISCSSTAYVGGDVNDEHIDRMYGYRHKIDECRRKSLIKK